MDDSNLALSWLNDLLSETRLMMTGTDTDVGKTWLGCQMIAFMVRMGRDVQVFKPVESGWKNPENSDAYHLAQAALSRAPTEQELSWVCPFRYKEPLSPFLAAELESSSVTIQQLMECITQMARPQTLSWIEGAGGVCSPLCRDGRNADLMKALACPVLLAVDDRLGAVNHALLSVYHLQREGLKVAGVLLNQRNVDVIHPAMDNQREIRLHLPNVPVWHWQRDLEPVLQDCKP